MIRRPFIFFLPVLLLALLLAGCGGRSGTPEQQAEDQPEEWHMSDELSGTRIGPEEEESFRQAAFDGDLEQVRQLLKQGVK